MQDPTHQILNITQEGQGEGARSSRCYEQVYSAPLPAGVRVICHLDPPLSTRSSAALCDRTERRHSPRRRCLDWALGPHVVGGEIEGRGMAVRELRGVRRRRREGSGMMSGRSREGRTKRDDR